MKAKKLSVKMLAKKVEAWKKVMTKAFFVTDQLEALLSKHIAQSDKEAGKAVKKKVKRKKKAVSE